jgi:hypothetical protein
MLTTLALYGQQGVNSYSFSGLTNFAFDEAKKAYQETDQKDLTGKIIINHLDRTIEIKYPDKTVSFKLKDIQVDPNSFRTMFHVIKDNKKYILAEAPRHMTLIGIDNKVIFNLTK